MIQDLHNYYQMEAFWFGDMILHMCPDHVHGLYGRGLLHPHKDYVIDAIHFGKSHVTDQMIRDYPVLIEMER